MPSPLLFQLVICKCFSGGGGGGVVTYGPSALIMPGPCGFSLVSCLTYSMGGGSFLCVPPAGASSSSSFTPSFFQQVFYWQGWSAGFQVTEEDRCVAVCT